MKRVLIVIFVMVENSGSVEFWSRNPIEGGQDRLILTNFFS
jgi:hypothetical protein